MVIRFISLFESVSRIETLPSVKFVINARLPLGVNLIRFGLAPT